MKKSKHFRKDVILARIIAAGILIALISLLVFAGSLLSKSIDKGNDGQNTQNSQSVNPGPQDSEEDTESNSESETGTEEESEVEKESESESESSSENALYVKTTTQVKLRAEANTNCATLDRIDGGTVLLVDEVLDGWYKVTHNGKTGYVSADYAKVVETE